MTKTKNESPIFDVSKAQQTIENGKFAKWWRRKGTKAKNFKYFDANGNQINNEKSLERIKSLVIPPAWKFVRISPKPNHKIQAVGMDKSGRVQYLYHPKFTEKQKIKKFAKIEKFGEHLPKLRKITNRHLELEGLPREKVLAVMIRLINSLYIRVGTEKSVKHYRTYGITTLQNRHLEIGKKGKLVFNFVGKHHIKHRKVLVDEDLAGIMQNIKSLGTKGKLFHYLDADGQLRSIKPAEINDYLKTLTSPEFSVKDFRTWGATYLAALEFAEIGKPDDKKTLKKNIVRVINKVAEQLGNTPTVCRGSYIHPTVLETYQNGVTLEEFIPKKKRRISLKETDDSRGEVALLKLFSFKNGSAK